MTLPAIVNPYEPFVGLTGTGLNNGHLYIGVDGQDPESDPQDCFWDAAGTILASQPIDIMGGYPMRLGTPAQVFTAGSYSMRVRDRAGVQVFYLASAGGSAVAGGVYATIAEASAANIPSAVHGTGFMVMGYYAAGDGGGAQYRYATVQGSGAGKFASADGAWWELAEVSITPLMLGAKADGATNDSTAIAATFTAAAALGVGEVRFPAGTYSVGALAAYRRVVELNGVAGLRVVAEGKVQIAGTWANDATNPYIFYHTNCSDISYVGEFLITDATGYDIASVHGVIGWFIDSTVTDVRWEKAAGQGLLGGIIVNGVADSRSVKRLTIAELEVTSCLYGLNCAQNGDDVTANIVATTSGRAYFVYGVRNHRIKVTEYNPVTGYQCLISTYEGTTNKTENIVLDHTLHTSSGDPGNGRICIQASLASNAGVPPGIQDIAIRFERYCSTPNANNSWGAVVTQARNITNGATVYSTNVAAFITNLSLTGNKNGNSSFDFNSEYTLAVGATKAFATWEPHHQIGYNALLSFNNRGLFAWSLATSSFDTAGWSILNGSATGYYQINAGGASMTVWGMITWGSGSVYGAGPLAIRLPPPPFPSAKATLAPQDNFISILGDDCMVGMASLYDSSANAFYNCPMVMLGNQTRVIKFKGIEGVAGGEVTSTQPFTWATGDKIKFMATIPQEFWGSVSGPI